MKISETGKNTEPHDSFFVFANTFETQEEVVVVIPLENSPQINKSLWKWVFCGVGLIAQLDDARVLLTLHYDDGVPSSPSHSTLPFGSSTSVRDLFYPLVASWREGVGKLCIVTSEKIICPVPADDHYGFGFEVSDVVRTTARQFPELAKKKFEEVRARFHPLEGERKLTVRHGDKSTTTRGLVVLDQSRMMIIFLKAVVLRVPCRLSELVVYDGEMGATGRLLDRQVRALELDENFKPTGKIVASWVGKERVPFPLKTVFQTPVLSALYQAL